MELVPRMGHLHLADDPAVAAGTRVHVDDTDRITPAVRGRVGPNDVRQLFRRGLGRHPRRRIKTRVGSPHGFLLLPELVFEPRDWSGMRRRVISAGDRYRRGGAFLDRGSSTYTADVLARQRRFLHREDGRDIDDHPHLGKWFWNDETVPTFYPPAARILHVNWNDWRSGFLREKNDSGSEFVSRTTRSIGCNQNIAAGSQNFAELQKRARAHARTRTADDIKSKTPRDVCDHVAVATGADQAGAGALWKKFLQYRRNQQQSIVPKRDDVISFNRLSDNARAVVHFVAQRSGQNLQQTKSKRDQPSRAPAFDLQVFFREVFAVWVAGQR